MKYVKGIILLLWDVFVYWKFVYPLWDNHFIFLLIFLPLGIVVAFFFTKGDGRHKFKELTHIHTVMRVVITTALFYLGSSEFNLLKNGAQDSKMFILTILVGASAILYTSFLLINLKDLFSSSKHSQL